MRLMPPAPRLTARASLTRTRTHAPPPPTGASHSRRQLGASSVEHLDANLNACTKAAAEGGGLPAPVVAAFDGAWDTTREGAFAYWRSYSADMPGRDELPQGASYAAHGPK